MDLSDYASKVGMKLGYLAANIILDLLIALMKKAEKHMENLDKNGEKTYVKRGLDKVRSLIAKSEINKLNMKIAESKLEVKTINKKIEKCENIVSTYELQRDKEHIKDEISKANNLISELNKNGKKNLSENDISNIEKIENALEQHKDNLKEIEIKIEDSGIDKIISNEQYEKAKKDRSELITQKDELEDIIHNNLEQKVDLKDKIESLKSKKVEASEQDLHNKKKQLQEELDVINRKMNSEKAKEENVNEVTSVKEEEHEEEHSKKENNIINISELEKEIKEKENNRQNQEEEQSKSQEEVFIPVAPTGEEIEEIKKAYRDMKLQLIENPELMNEIDFKNKFEQTENAMEKFSLLNETEKDMPIKTELIDENKTHKKGIVVPINITPDKQGFEDIKNVYREIKLLSIEKPELLKDPEYKSKFKQAEELMKKYDLFKHKDREMPKVKSELAR